MTQIIGTLDLDENLERVVLYLSKHHPKNKLDATGEIIPKTGIDPRVVGMIGKTLVVNGLVEFNDPFVTELMNTRTVGFNPTLENTPRFRELISNPSNLASEVRYFNITDLGHTVFSDPVIVSITSRAVLTSTTYINEAIDTHKSIIQTSKETNNPFMYNDKAFPLSKLRKELGVLEKLSNVTH